MPHEHLVHVGMPREIRSRRQRTIGTMAIDVRIAPSVVDAIGMPWVPSLFPITQDRHQRLWMRAFNVLKSSVKIGLHLLNGPHFGRLPRRGISLGKFVDAADAKVFP